MSFLLTGCCYSGTTWASRLLSELGHPCDHERWRPGRRNRPHHRGDSSWWAVPHLPVGVPTVHLVRDPIRVVRSGVRTGLFSDWRIGARVVSVGYVRRHRPDILAAADHLGRLIRFAATWDRSVAGHVLHVDRHGPAEVVAAVRHLTGVRHTHRDVAEVLAELGTRINAHGGDEVPLSWPEIEAHPDGHLLVDKARMFGYLP